MISQSLLSIPITSSPRAAPPLHYHKSVGSAQTLIAMNRLSGLGRDRRHRDPQLRRLRVKVSSAIGESRVDCASGDGDHLPANQDTPPAHSSQDLRAIRRPILDSDIGPPARATSLREAGAGEQPRYPRGRGSACIRCPFSVRVIKDGDPSTD